MFSMCEWPTLSTCVPAYVLIDSVDKPLPGFILQADSWGVDALPDCIVSSSALIPLAPKPGLHFHNIILAEQAWGSRCNPQMSWCDADTWRARQKAIKWCFTGNLLIFSQ